MRTLLTAAVPVFLFAACGTPRSNACDNCSGCCSQYDTCEAGMAASECGSNGYQCVACPSGQTCSSGNCVENSGGGAGGGTGGGGGGSGACGPANCSGCCFNGACQAGTATAACGTNGGACVTCTGPNICSTTQTCALDPGSQWRLVPVSGSFSTTGDWDVGNGAPDTRVFLYCPAGAATASVSTPEVSDNFTPTYTATGSCIMTASALMTTGFDIRVIDVDLTSDDVIMTGTIKLASGNFTAGTVT